MKTIGRNVLFFWFHALEQGIGQKSEYTQEIETHTQGIQLMDYH